MTYGYAGHFFRIWMPAYWYVILIKDIFRKNILSIVSHDYPISIHFIESECFDIECHITSRRGLPWPLPINSPELACEEFILRKIEICTCFVGHMIHESDVQSYDYWTTLITRSCLKGLISKYHIHTSYIHTLYEYTISWKVWMGYVRGKTKKLDSCWGSGGPSHLYKPCLVCIYSGTATSGSRKVNMPLCQWNAQINQMAVPLWSL